jgi:hypothetical protein
LKLGEDREEKEELDSEGHCIVTLHLKGEIVKPEQAFVARQWHGTQVSAEKNQQ